MYQQGYKNFGLRGIEDFNYKYRNRNRNSNGNSTIVIGDYVFPLPVPFDMGMPYVQQINNEKDFSHFLKLIKQMNPKETPDDKIINLISALLLKNKKMDDFDLPNAILNYMNGGNSNEDADILKFLTSGPRGELEDKMGALRDLRKHQPDVGNSEYGSRKKSKKRKSKSKNKKKRSLKKLKTKN